MNGKERNISLFRKLSAYIMQDNQLHANLTVEEAMNVAANLKLSQKVLRGEKMSVVSDTKLMNKPNIRKFQLHLFMTNANCLTVINFNVCGLHCKIIRKALSHRLFALELIQFMNEMSQKFKKIINFFSFLNKCNQGNNFV